MKAWQVARLRRERQLFAERRAHNGRMLSGFGGLVVSTLLVMLVFGAAGGTAFAIYSANAASFEPPEEAIAKLPRGGAKIYDRNGTLLYEFVDQQNGVRRPVSLDHVSDWVIEATIATEDPSFYDNVGVNVRGLARAGYENFMPQEGDEFFAGSGGSSITQQLAKNVYIPREERAERSITRKIRETVIALELTEKYSKDQILEWYLNTIPYGGIYVGIEAAAEGYFGKSASDLTLAEAALLAGIPQAPGRYDPLRNFALAKARQEEVLRLMVKHGSINQADAERAAAEPLELHEQQFVLEAPHFVLGRVANEIRARFGERALYDEGLKVTTTLDLPLQRKAQEVMEKWLSEHEARTNTHNGALMAMVPGTGEVLVYLGSRDYFDDSIQGNNDNIVALNSPGSTLKPFTYMTTFTKGWGTGTPIPDVPMSIRDGTQVFTPTNPGDRYHGLVSVAEALGNSLNVPALQAILYAGVDDTVEMLRRVGYTTFDDRSQYGPALTLGGTDIRLEESVIGYGVLANGGKMAGAASAFEREPGERTIDPAILLKVENAEGKVLYEFDEPETEQVVPEALAYMPVSILSDPANTRLTFSRPVTLRNGMPSAAKTGTSEPFPNSKAVGETWTIGFTTELVAGIWAGNTDNEPIDNNTYSTTIAWNAWNEFMIAAHEMLGIEGQPFERPAEGLVERNVNGRTGLFLDGNVQVTSAWWRSPDNNLQVNYQGRIPDLRSNDRRDRQDEEQQNEDQQDGQQQDQQREGATFAAITSPGDGQVVSGRVAITGTATTPGFSSMTVDVFQGSSGARLATSESPSAGVLAVWDTTGLPNGQYTLRLTVQDTEHGTMVSTINVTVQN